MRCLHVKTINGVPCQCIKRVRASSKDSPHTHQFELSSKISPFAKQSLINHYQNQIKKAVAKFIACSNLAAKQAENKALQELIDICIKAGQEIPEKPISHISPVINRHNIIPIIHIAAEEHQKQRLLNFKEGFSSLCLDAATLIHRHFLDFVVCPPSVKGKPILFDAVEVSRLGAKEYGTIVLNTITELFLNGVRIGSIIGDNHPVQKAALAHFSPTSVIKTSECDAVKGIRFFSCGAHTSSLMIEMAVTESPILNRFDSILKGVIASINETPLKRIVGHCPTTAPTRWLSRINSIDWVLKREEILKNALNHEWITADREARTKANLGINFENFEAMRVFARVLYPFFKMIKIFEKDSSTQADIFPVTNAVRNFFKQVKDDDLFLHYPGVIDCVINAIDHYVTTCYDWPLLALSYFITLEGRAWFISEIAEEEFANKWDEFYKKNYDFTYNLMNEINSDQETASESDEAEQISSEDDSVEIVIERAKETLMMDDNFEEEEISEEVIPPQQKISLYDDSLEALISLASDLGLDKDVLPVQFSIWMFDTDLDEFLWKNRNVPNKMLWQALSGNENIKVMRRSITRILSARATETSVEREFSKDKLILGRLRSRMDNKLLKSRSILMESI